MTIIEGLPLISILVAIWAAISGIESWRREHRWKRQVELAEDTLALFYEAKDAIADIRHPAGYETETASVKRDKNESNDQYAARKSASVVYLRYTSYTELFNKLHAMRYRFMSIIGRNKAKSFDELRQVENNILLASRTLARLWAKNSFRTKEQYSHHQESLERHEEVFWGTGDSDDKIAVRVDEIISNMEEVCKQVISSPEGIHEFFNAPRSISCITRR